LRAVKSAEAKQEPYEREFDRWVEPFLEAFQHKVRRKWAPLYIRGLLAPGDRKSVEPLAERVAPGDVAQLHHFVAASAWDCGALEDVLASKANALVGGEKAHLIIDDTALPKKGGLSVGVAHQYCGALGKQANCQVLVSATLACDEVPLAVGLKLFLPEQWASDEDRRRKAYVPEDVVHRPKWQIALEEIDRLIACGVTFGDVLADAGYGMCGEFRNGLTARGLLWTVGILSTQGVYSVGARVIRPRPSAVGRRPTRGVPSERATSAEKRIAGLGARPFRRISWRRGTKGPLQGEFAAVRVRVGDGPRVKDGIHLPGDEVWLIAERRTDETRYYLSNLPANASLKALATSIKARWVCEQAHQQMKEELGLDHFEGRSWHGLHHHALLTMVAFAFLQHVRLRENKA
jgi:SRSO17 transposase